MAQRGLGALALLWAGVLIGVVTIAVPAQFGAPDLDRATGIAITGQVFSVLGRVEIGLVLAMAALAVVARPGLWSLLALALVGLVVVVEQAWLLPALAARVELVVAGGTPAPAPWHRLYVGLEGTKVLALLWVGWTSSSSRGRTRAVRGGW